MRFYLTASPAAYEPMRTPPMASTGGWNTTVHYRIPLSWGEFPCLSAAPLGRPEGMGTSRGIGPSARIRIFWKSWRTLECRAGVVLQSVVERFCGPYRPTAIPPQWLTTSPLSGTRPGPVL